MDPTPGRPETVSQSKAVQLRVPGVQFLPLGEYVRSCDLQDSLFQVEALRSSLILVSIEP